MFVKVQIPSSESRASIFIPESAVRYSIGGEFVYVFQGGLVRRKKILLGENKEGWIQVKIGLHPTEKVLVTGFENLYDGAAVRVIK
jgi:multidrug efflux system membrane fusion protein